METARAQHTIELGPEDEFRFEVGPSSIQIQLLDGTAEICGSELARGAMSKLYEYSFTNIAGFLTTWSGCRLLVDGNCDYYVERTSTFSRYILNIHACLEEKRLEAQKNHLVGPKIIIIGPPGSGKSSFCLTLLNYAARASRTITYVDLDVGGGSITVPGTLSAIVIEKPVLMSKGWGKAIPLVFPFGSPEPTHNDILFKTQLNNLTKTLTTMNEKFPEADASGWIINAPNWSTTEGYKLLLETVASVEPTIIVVLGYDKLVSDLTLKFNEKILAQEMNIIEIPRSTGVIYQGPEKIAQDRQTRIREYFYGLAREIGPARVSLPLEHFHVVSIQKQGQMSLTALPIGQEAPQEEELEVVPVVVDKTIRHSLLAVSFASSLEEVISSNIGGYLHVIEVDLEKKKIICTSPVERLQYNYLVLTDFKFTDV